MDLFLCIGGTRLQIKAADKFLSALSPREKNILNSFIIKPPFHTPRSSPIVKVNISILEKEQLSGGRSLDLRQAELFNRAFSFPAANEKAFRMMFGLFVKFIFPEYLKCSGMKKNKAMRLIKEGISSNRYVIYQEGAVICRRHLLSYDIIYLHPCFMEEGLKNRWFYNLNPLRLLLRMVIGNNSKGSLIHASSIEYKNNGYAFIGPGNSGKSTTSRLVASDRVLSDDITLIKNMNGQYYIYPNPWWNLERDGIKVNKPMTGVRLKALFFIRKSSKSGIKRINNKEALGRLLFGDWAFQQLGFLDNKTGVMDFYLLSQELVKKVPCFILKVKKGPAFRQEFKQFIRRED